MTGILQVMTSLGPVTVPTPILYLDANDYIGTGTNWDANIGSDATLVNTPTFVGPAPTYFSFNNATAEKATGPDLGNLSNWSVECWFRPTTSLTTTYSTLITDTYDSISKINYCVGFNQNGVAANPMQVGFFDGAWHLTPGYTPTTNVWCHCIATYDSATIKMYINGNLYSQLSYAGTSQSSGLGYRIAARWDTQIAPNDFFPGDIGLIRIWNSAINAQQVNNLYNQNLNRFSNSVLTTNLVGYWDPSIIASYAGSGTTINSLGSTSLPGTMSNITWADPYFVYNGSNSQVSIADNAVLEPGSGDWTMEVWVNQNAIGNDVVLGKFDPGGLSADVSYSIRTTNSTYYAQIGSGSGSGSTLFVNSTNFVGTLNTWYQLVYVFKNGGTQTLETYVNGISIGSVNHSLASILNTSTNLYIGSYNNGEYAQWFDGKIGIVRLYSSALTSAEVLQNFNANKGLYGL
jgi:hypothetical protein